MLPKQTLLKCCKCTADELCGPAIHQPQQQLERSSSTLRVMARIVRLEGAGALYAGLSPTLVLSIPSTAMYFTSYEAILRRLKQQLPNQNHGLLAMGSGALARTGAAVVFSPLELIRVQMQTAENPHSFRTLVRIVATGGPSHLFRGLGATLARDIPFSGIYWSGIETSKPLIRHQLLQSATARDADPQMTHVAVAFLSGVAAGTLATVATHPFDVVKTRAQASLYGGPAKSPRQMLHDVWLQEGLRGLYAGLVPRVAKVAPACAIMISTYEAGKIALKLDDSR